MIRQPTPTESAALALGVVAVGAWAAWQWSDVADDWMPEVGASAITVGITITVVERVVRHEAERRSAPIAEDAMRQMWNAIPYLIAHIAADYAETHLDNYQPPPRGLIAALDHWLACADTGDAPRTLEEDGEPMFVDIAEITVRQLLEVRQNSSHVLHPEMAASIDQFVRSVRGSLNVMRTSVFGYGRMDLTGIMPAFRPEDRHASAIRSIVENTRKLTEVYARQPGAVTELDETYEGLIDMMRNLALRARAAESSAD